jgi:hypothetical protein
MAFAFRMVIIAFRLSQVTIKMSLGFYLKRLLASLGITICLLSPTFTVLKHIFHPLLQPDRKPLQYENSFQIILFIFTVLPDSEEKQRDSF